MAHTASGTPARTIRTFTLYRILRRIFGPARSFRLSFGRA